MINFQPIYIDAFSRQNIHNAISSDEKEKNLWTKSLISTPLSHHQHDEKLSKTTTIKMTIKCYVILIVEAGEALFDKFCFTTGKVYFIKVGVYKQNSWWDMIIIIIITTRGKMILYHKVCSLRWLQHTQRNEQVRWTLRKTMLKVTI